MAPISPGPSAERPTVSVSVDVVRYDPTLGVGTFWEEDSTLRVDVWETPEQTVVISGNASGLISLARHLLTLAQADVPEGRHFDFDTYGGWLDNGSSALRIERDRR
jgi:hypothetical protein